MTYKPGLHIIAEFQDIPSASLTDSRAFRNLVDSLIAEHGLNKVGEVYHDFDNGGYTAVVCLTESHLSVHTWPEFGIATFDVFLSNFRRDNENRAETIYEAVRKFYRPGSANKTGIRR